MSNSDSQHKHNSSKGKKADDASKFKKKSMNSIKRRRLVRKIALISLSVIAALMAVAVVFAYTIG